MKLQKHILLLVLLIMFVTPLNAQVGIKSNLLGWGTTTPNLGVEVGLTNHSTLQIMGYLNPWDFANDRHFHIWMVQPEYRYWFCDKMNGHFVGIHAVGGQYNAKKLNFPLHSLMWGDTYERNENFPSSDHEGGWPDIMGDNSGRHVEGWYIGCGLTYGYQWILSHHWNLEASIGVGYVYSPLKYYGRCQQVINRRHLNYFGPTNAQLSLMYIF